MKQIIFVIVAIALLSTGCAPIWQPSPASRWMKNDWQMTEIQKEIQKRQHRPSSQNKNNYILALLHTHPNNQRPNYGAAKKYLKKYLAGLSPGRKDPQAQYMYHLLEKISWSDEEIGRFNTQLETRSAEQSDSQMKQAACQKKLKKVKGSLWQSKKKVSELNDQLEKFKESTKQDQAKITRLQIENGELKEQLEDLTELYINLEKKRRAIQ